MDIDNLEVQIKKYDRKKNYVIANVIVCGVLEIRGYVARYTPTKYSTNPVFIVSPPTVPTRSKKRFWVVRLKDSALWEQLKEKIIEKAREHANSL